MVVAFLVFGRVNHGHFIVELFTRIKITRIREIRKGLGFSENSGIRRSLEVGGRWEAGGGPVGSHGSPRLISPSPSAGLPL